MDVRKAEPSDAIMVIYRSSQDFMIRSGNPTQWGRFNPTREMIEKDIAEGRCRVLTQDGTVHGVFALCRGEEPNYRVIENGAWPNEEPYVTIHRIAGDGVAHGIFRAATDYCAARYDHIRIDTHADNRVMQRKIEACGFVKCGVIRVANGSPRIAYQWDRPAR